MQYSLYRSSEKVRLQISVLSGTVGHDLRKLESQGRNRNVTVLFLFFTLLEHCRSSSFHPVLRKTRFLSFSVVAQAALSHLNRRQLNGNRSPKYCKVSGSAWLPVKRDFDHGESMCNLFLPSRSGGPKQRFVYQKDFLFSLSRLSPVRSPGQTPRHSTRSDQLRFAKLTKVDTAASQSKIPMQVEKKLRIWCLWTGLVPKSSSQI